jgi:hypothetical protein
MADIFISYSRKDCEQALSLAEWLQGEGMEVWIDKYGIVGAEKSVAEIAEVIKGCSTFLILISRRNCLPYRNTGIRGGEAHGGENKGVMS